MSKINAMLDVGKRSLMNSQTALQTVGHNIANKNTEGYSRQRVEILSNPAVSAGGNIRIGTGARAGVVTRTNNPYLEKQLQNEGAELGYTKARADAMTQVESVYNEQLNKGLNTYVSDFFNSYRELSNQPDSLTARTLVKESADFLTKDFKRANDQLVGVQKNVDNQVVTQVEQINAISSEIAKLNQQIKSVEINNQTQANDERDRRDLLLKQLGGIVDAKYAEGQDGMVAVHLGPTVLVSGVNHYELQTYNTPERDRMEIFYNSDSEKATPVQVTKFIKGGELGGALEVRDQVVSGLRDKLDQLALNFAGEVNQLHQAGTDRYGKKGADLFTFAGETKNFSSSIQLNDDVMTDVGRIVAGVKPDAAGDNTVANAISALQYKGVMDETAGTTLDDYYNAMVGEVGTGTQRALKEHESQGNIVSQLANLRESLSGVSLDEEAAKMIEFQKGFDASARLIRTADEMLETIINLKR